MWFCCCECSVQAKGKRKGGAGGLNKLCSVSPELQVIVGQPTMPRTEVRSLHNLQLLHFSTFYYYYYVLMGLLELELPLPLTCVDCEATLGIHKEEQPPRPE